MAGKGKKVEPLSRDGTALYRTSITGFASRQEAEALCDRIALLHLGTVRAEGSPAQLKAALARDATLEDVFRHHTGGSLAGDTTAGGLRAIRSTRRTARRVG